MSPRRYFLVLVSIPFLFLLALVLASRPPFSQLFLLRTSPEEIFGLIHFVTSPDEAGRTITTTFENGLGDAIVPEEPVELDWYALGSITISGQEWSERMNVLRTEYPLVVFSKTYCPYSKRAKKLLEAYSLSPPPKIVEVDLRADATHVKTLLTRLTHRSTFPNVILHGRSLGGSDDIARLHRQGKLRDVLEKGRVRVGWDGEGAESL